VYVCDVFGLVWGKRDISLVGAHRFKKFWQIIGFGDEKKGARKPSKKTTFYFSFNVPILYIIYVLLYIMDHNTS
jgi:hypothetical protein